MRNNIENLVDLVFGTHHLDYISKLGFFKTPETLIVESKSFPKFALFGSSVNKSFLSTSFYWVKLKLGGQKSLS